MSFKNKVIVLVVCVITAVSGIFAGPANIVRAEDLATISTAGMSLDQLQQLIIKLQEQIDYIVQILAQQKPVCGNGACETAKGETAASCAQDCGTICQTVANLGGVLKQQAALISWNGKLIITGTGGDDALWAYEYVVNDTSKNKPWYSLAGIIKPGTQMKMAASSGGAEIIAESIGSDGQLWARKYTSSNSAWSDWVLASTFSTDTVNNFVAGPFEAILTASTSDPDYGYVFKTALNSDGSTSIIKCQKKAALVCGRTNLLPGDNARCTAAGGTFSCPNAACYDGKSANCVGARCTCKCNTNCAKEGEKIYMWQPQAYGLSKTPATAPRVCCADLTPYGGANENVIDGKCVRNQYTVMNATLTCIKCGDGVCNASAGENICSCAADCGGSSIFIPVNITTKSSQNPASISATFNVRVAAKSGDVYIPKVNAFTVKAVKDNGSDTAAWLNVISNYSQPAGTVLTNNSIKIFQGTTANFIVTAEHMITAVPGSYDLRITGIGWNANDSAIYSVYVPDSFYGWRSEAVYFGNAICGNSTCDVGETAVSCPQDCPKAGQSCTSGGQCASGKCLNGVCCAGGQCGNAGKCYNKDATATIDGVTQKCVYEATWKYVDNTRCTALSQCASGKCLNGVCCAGGQCGNAGKCYSQNTTAVIDGATQVCYSEGTWKIQ